MPLARAKGFRLPVRRFAADMPSSFVPAVYDVLGAG
jgi:hypothetical protein